VYRHYFLFSDSECGVKIFYHIFTFVGLVHRMNSFMRNMVHFSKEFCTLFHCLTYKFLFDMKSVMFSKTCEHVSGMSHSYHL
jgi:hypothetical protein